MLLPEDDEDQIKLQEMYEIGNNESILDNTFLNQSLHLNNDTRFSLKENISTPKNTKIN